MYHHVTLVMLELNHNMRLSDNNMPEFGRHKKESSPVNFHRRFADWTVKTHHTESVLPRQFFIHFAFHGALQEAQTGVK